MYKPLCQKETLHTLKSEHIREAYGGGALSRNFYLAAESRTPCRRPHERALCHANHTYVLEIIPITNIQYMRTYAYTAAAGRPPITGPTSELR